MQAALHGLGPLRGPQAVDAPQCLAGAGCQLGLVPCDPRVMSPFYPPPPFFDEMELQRNHIVRKPNGEFYCKKCWKTPVDEYQLQHHLQSKEHERRMAHERYELDPLADVPHPHREFTAIINGWAVCTICNKKMDESHWNSTRHIQHLNYNLAGAGRSAGCNVAPLSQPPLPLPLLDQPPLTQPPPPPERPSIGFGMPVGGSLPAPQSLAPATHGTNTSSGAQTYGGAHQDSCLAGSCAPSQGAPLQGYMATASGSQPPHSTPDVYSSVASQPPPAAQAPVARLPQAAALQNHQQHPWGSRSPNGEVLNAEEWNHILQEFDNRYSKVWWSIDTEWEFFDV